LVFLVGFFVDASPAHYIVEVKGHQMGTRKQQQQAKRAKRHQKRRQKALTSRKKQQPKSSGLQDAASWPVAECFASSHWYDQGAQIAVVLSRSHQSGQSAIVEAEIDLSGPGVVSLRSGLVPSKDHVLGRATQFDEHMMEVSPAQAVALLQTGAQLGNSVSEHDLNEALGLFASVDTEPALEVLTGPPPTAAAPQRESWFSRMLGRLLG
jgi:hypothetical protein